MHMEVLRVPFGSCGLHRNLTQKLFFAEYCFAFCDRPHTPVDQLRLIKELSCGTTTYTRGQHTRSRAGEPKPPSNARKNSARRKEEFLSGGGDKLFNRLRCFFAYSVGPRYINEPTYIRIPLQLHGVPPVYACGEVPSMIFWALFFK